MIKLFTYYSEVGSLSIRSVNKGNKYLLSSIEHFKFTGNDKFLGLKKRMSFKIKDV